MAQQKTIRTITAIAVLMLLYSGQASASFKNCFVDCIADCDASARDQLYCVFKCLAKCAKVESSNKLNNCNLCAIAQCARFDNDVDKVDDCVSKCDVNKCNRLSQAMAHAPVSTSPGKPSNGAPLEG